MSKRDLDPDTRAHYARQDTAHETSQRNHRNALTRTTHGDALAALHGLDRPSKAGASPSHRFQCNRSDLSTYLNRLYQAHRVQALFRAAMTASNLKLNAFQLDGTAEDLDSIEKALDACESLSETERSRARELLYEVRDAIDDFASENPWR